MTRAVLTDIEGTTSSISFVHDVLFPYAREHMASFIRDHRNDPDVAARIDAVRATVRDLRDDVAVIRQLQQWIDEDRKITSLKALQGMIWAAGYRNGDFAGHVYEDAARNLRAWHESGLKLYVFSSGSVPAQRLLFGHSEYGDLTPLFSGYFDTTTGAKKDPAAYTAIAAETGLAASDILFLSDTGEELDAAHESGMKTVRLVRGDDTGSERSRHPQARSFDEIAPDTGY